MYKYVVTEATMECMQPNCVSKLAINEQDIIDPQRICNEFNQYFSSVGENLF